MPMAVRSVSQGVRTHTTVTGRNGISAQIVADSVTERGDRVTTYELEYPRFIHSEFMTHRLLSKNSASSRAIPVSKMVKHIKQDTAIPIHWGKNQSGMQAKDENDRLVWVDEKMITKEDAWLSARDSAIDYAEAFAESDYHKQIANRLVEPFKMMKVVCTGTEYDNFFWLRLHADAQPEIRELADTMYKALNRNKPQELLLGEYHLPYVTPEVQSMCESYRSDADPQELALKISASCCAQVSYRTANTSLSKALKIYDMLVKAKPIHASPFEHQARPIDEYDINCFKTKNPLMHGLTHVDRNGEYWSGNLKGFVQYRHEIPDNTCWNYSEE